MYDKDKEEKVKKANEEAVRVRQFCRCPKLEEINFSYVLTLTHK